jgi:hypothetical protein
LLLKANPQSLNQPLGFGSVVLLILHFYIRKLQLDRASHAAVCVRASSLSPGACVVLLTTPGSTQGKQCAVHAVFASSTAKWHTACLIGHKALLAQPPWLMLVPAAEAAAAWGRCCLAICFAVALTTSSSSDRW